MVVKTINGFSIYGFNCVANNNKILGSYAFFLKNNIIVYADFLNYGITNKPNEYADFLNLQNTFLNDFTKYLKSYGLTL